MLIHVFLLSFYFSSLHLHFWTNLTCVIMMLTASRDKLTIHKDNPDVPHGNVYNSNTTHCIPAGRLAVTQTAEQANRGQIKKIKKNCMKLQSSVFGKIIIFFLDMLLYVHGKTLKVCGVYSLICLYRLSLIFRGRMYLKV